MKFFFVEKLKELLAFLAKATIAKYQPSIIGITGSVGKTSAKEAIYATLKDARSVRVARGNFNTEFGLPLTILGDWSAEDLNLVSRGGPVGAALSKMVFWLKVVLTSLSRLISRTKYPEILILEYGVQKPGDMKYLLEIARPNIGIMTALGEIPVHVEFFSGKESLVREKGRLLEAAPAIGFVILNADDEVVYEMGERVRAHIMTFGFNKDSEVRISNLENLSTEDHPWGAAFKISYGGSLVPVRFADTFGKPQAYAAAAATCVGLIFGINLVRIAESLSKNYQPAKHRMNLIRGRRGEFILDDCYNAAPLSMHAAIETVQALTAKRKIGVLGDMLELGQFGVLAHEEIGRLAGKIFGILITVGKRGKIIAEAAVKDGVINKKNVKNFETAQEALPEVVSLLKSGDLVLIKASRGIGLDVIVDALSDGMK